MKWPDRRDPPHSIIKAMGWTVEEFLATDLALLKEIPNPEDFERIVKNIVELLAVPGSYFMANEGRTMGVAYNDICKDHVLLVRAGPLLDRLIEITCNPAEASKFGVKSIDIPIEDGTSPTIH